MRAFGGEPSAKYDTQVDGCCALTRPHTMASERILIGTTGGVVCLRVRAHYAGNRGKEDEVCEIRRKEPVEIIRTEDFGTSGCFEGGKRDSSEWHVLLMC